ncbi:PKD domain-containing protein [Nanohaloarchaea archaeon]|nr:PKD domain-containing protein [Candidatus Nanohaloarchaea archaeon]
MRWFKMNKLLITSLFFVFLSASVLGQPTGPQVLDGEVTLNNESITGTIEARYDGDVLSSAEAEDGEFSDLAVQNVDVGTEVDVYISGVEADQNVTYEPWAVEEKNFSASFDEEENVTVTNVRQNVSKDEGLDIEVPEQASKQSSGVDGLNISVNEDVNDVEVNITVSDEANDEVNKQEIQDIEDSGSTFLGVIDVDTNILEAARGSATIGFKANKSVVAEPQDVVLIHYENGNRVGVLESSYRETKTQNQNDDFYYLSADTSSFSSFAITSDTTDPEAVVDSDQTDIEPGETVEFDGSGSSDDETGISSYAWDFGDGEGNVGNETIISHTFDDTGTYTVELTVSDQAGNEDRETVDISVEEPDTGGGGSVTTDTAGDDSTGGSDEEETEPDTQEQSEDSSEQDDSSGDQQEDTTQDDGSSDQGDTGAEDSEQDAEDQTDTQQTPDTPTGQFFTSDTGIAGGLLILLVVLVVYLEYTGRIELRELKEVVKQKTSN